MVWSRFGARRSAGCLNGGVFPYKGIREGSSGGEVTIEGPEEILSHPYIDPRGGDGFVVDGRA